MPQMSPIMWNMILMMTSILTTMNISNMYFNKNLKMKKNKKKMNNIFIKW